MQQSLAVSELDTISALCSSLHLLGTDEDIAGRLLAPVGSAIGAESAACRHVRFQSGKACILHLSSIGVKSRVADDYLGHFQCMDPLLSSLAKKLPVGTDSTVNGAGIDAEKTGSLTGHFSLQEENNTFPDTGESFRRYYKSFLAPNGLVHHSGFMLVGSNGLNAWIFNFHRGPSSSGFSDLESARTRLIKTCLQGQLGSLDNNHVFAKPESQHFLDKGKPEILCQLSQREQVVAYAVFKGLGNKQIAASLNISTRTVENHLRNIYEKLKINSRTRLVNLLVHQNYTRAQQHGE